MAAAPQDLRHDRILVPEPSINSPKYARATQFDAHLKVRQRHAKLLVMRLAEEEVPKAQPFRLLIQVRDDGDDRLPLRLVLWHGGVCDAQGRPDFFLHTGQVVLDLDPNGE